MNYKKISTHYISPMNFTRNKTGWYRLRIDGYPTKYELNRNGELRNIVSGKIVPSHGGQNNTYIRYSLIVPELKDKRSFTIPKHRLLAACFIPIPKHFKERGYDQTTLVVNHIDGNKANPTLDNLEWVTTRGNAVHAQQTGLLDSYSGENSHLSKITADDARLICEELQNGYKPREVSEKYGYSLSTCTHIYNRECWKRISKDYDFSKAKSKRVTLGVDNLVKKSYDEMDRICSENKEIAELLHMDNFDNSTNIDSDKIMKKHYVRYVITSSSNPNKEWQRIVVNGIKTKYKVNRDGIVKDSETGDICELHKHGHIDVYLHIPEIKKDEIALSISRVVASIFLPIPRKYRELGLHSENFKIGYKDRNTHNVSLDNLEWVLPVPKSPLINDFTDADADRVCKLLDAGIKPRQIAEKTGYSVNTIRNIRKGYSWTHISKNYSFLSRYEEEKPRRHDEDLVKSICEELESGKLTFSEIGDKYGVTRQFIGKVYNRDVFENISKNYVFVDRHTRNKDNNNYKSL